MVGRGVEYEGIGIAEHHACYHAAHFLAAGEHRGFLQDFFTGEKHFAEESFEVYLAGVVAELAEPVNKIEIGIEECGIVEREICRGDGLPPVLGAGIRFAVAGYYLEEGGHCAWVAAEKCDFVAFLHLEIHVGEESLALNGCA